MLIGSAALSGCGEESSSQRDIYRTRTDCQRDWGSDPRQCESARGGAHAGYFYGPSYRGSSGTPGTTTLPRYGSSAIGTAQTSRGGIGSSASSHSSGGS